MTGLSFERQAPVPASHPNRTDVGCFVGLVGRRRDTALPADTERWLRERGWLHAGYLRPPVADLLDLPVPIDSWEEFDHLFEWERRDGDGGGPPVATYLGAAVRSFFAQGGRRCYVVRAGDERSSVSWAGFRVLTPLSDLLFEDQLDNARDFAESWQPQRGSFAATAAGLRAVASTPGDLALADFQPVGFDSTVEATIRASSAAAVGGLVARYGDADNYYFADLTPGIRRPLLELGKRVAGVETVLASRTLPARRGGGHLVRLEVVGDRLSATVDDGLSLDAVDASHAAGGAGVRLGRPADRQILRRRRLQQLLPGFPGSLEVQPADRNSWSGIGHLCGLPDVSFLCLPDLGEIVRAAPPAGDVSSPPAPAPAERFVVCSDPQPQPPRDNLARLLPAPRSDEDGYLRWAEAVGLVARFLASRRREVQLVAAVPLAAERTAAAADLHRFLLERLGLDRPLEAEDPQAAGLASAFVQLVYPWVRTPGSSHLPEGLESPDGAVAGLLARNSLTRGTFRSAARLDIGDVFAVAPPVDREQQLKPADGGQPLIERVSLLGETPAGLRLLSDVTTSLDAGYRPAAVNRLISLLVRAARRLGEEETFESSGPQLWSRLAARIRDLLLTLYEAGALRGATAAEAFDVRCDRSTMTQHDLDHGRAVVEVQFEAALPIDRITVVLALDGGGSVSLLGVERREEAA